MIPHPFRVPRANVDGTEYTDAKSAEEIRVRYSEWCHKLCNREWRCNTCGKLEVPGHSLIKCQGCDQRHFSYCSSKCREEDRVNHKWECIFIQYQRDYKLVGPDKAYAALLVWREEKQIDWMKPQQERYEREFNRVNRMSL